MALTRTEDETYFIVPHCPICKNTNLISVIRTHDFRCKRNNLFYFRYIFWRLGFFTEPWNKEKEMFNIEPIR